MAITVAEHEVTKYRVPITVSMDYDGTSFTKAVMVIQLLNEAEEMVASDVMDLELGPAEEASMAAKLEGRLTNLEGDTGWTRVTDVAP